MAVPVVYLAVLILYQWVAPGDKSADTPYPLVGMQQMSMEFG